MRLRSTPEVDLEEVVVQFPGESELAFLIRHQTRSDQSADRSPCNPTIRLSIDSFQAMVRKRPRTFDENTKLVRYVIEGLATINRRWPLCKDPQFYSNLDQYAAKGIAITEFCFPSDEELARL